MSLCARIGKNLFRRTLAFENVIWQQICDYSGKAKFTFQWVGNLEMLTWLLLPGELVLYHSLESCERPFIVAVPKQRSGSSNTIFSKLWKSRRGARFTVRHDVIWWCSSCHKTARYYVSRKTHREYAILHELHWEVFQVPLLVFLFCFVLFRKYCRPIFGPSRKGRTSEKNCGNTFQQYIQR